MTILLGTCERLCARISERQCGANRERGTFACDGCSGLEKLHPVGYQPPQRAPEPVKDVTQTLKVLKTFRVSPPAEVTPASRPRPVCDVPPEITLQILRRIGQIMERGY
jgi:hypothetical protein